MSAAPFGHLCQTESSGSIEPPWKSITFHPFPSVFNLLPRSRSLTFFSNSSRLFSLPCFSSLIFSHPSPPLCLQPSLSAHLTLSLLLLVPLWSLLSGGIKTGRSDAASLEEHCQRGASVWEAGTLKPQTILHLDKTVILPGSWLWRGPAYMSLISPQQWCEATFLSFPIPLRPVLLWPFASVPSLSLFTSLYPVPPSPPTCVSPTPLTLTLSQSPYLSAVCLTYLSPRWNIKQSAGSSPEGSPQL